MDLLAETHLLLREFGWEPEYEPPDHASFGGWRWTRLGFEGEIWTAKEPNHPRQPVPPYALLDPRPALCTEYPHGLRGKAQNHYFSIEDLRQRLEELAKK